MKNVYFLFIFTAFLFGFDVNFVCQSVSARVSAVKIKFNCRRGEERASISGSSLQGYGVHGTFYSAVPLTILQFAFIEFRDENSSLSIQFISDGDTLETNVINGTHSASSPSIFQLVIS